MTTKIISVLLSLCIMCSCSKPPSKNLVGDRLKNTSVETGKGDTDKEDTGNEGAGGALGNSAGNPPPNPHHETQDNTPQSSVFWNTNRPFWDNLWHWNIFHYWDVRHYGGAVLAGLTIWFGHSFYKKWRISKATLKDLVDARAQALAHEYVETCIQQMARDRADAAVGKDATEEAREAVRAREYKQLKEQKYIQRFDRQYLLELDIVHYTQSSEEAATEDYLAERRKYGLMKAQREAQKAARKKEEEEKKKEKKKT